MWSGSISFGLVSLPISIYNTSESKDISFKQLCKDGHRIRHKNFCDNGDEIPYPEIIKGYEITKDNYLVISKEELDNLKLESNKNIEIKEFVDINDLDPLLIEKSYYAVPNSKIGGNKPFQLLTKILHDTNKIGIGQIVIKDREQIVAIRYYQNCLMIHILKYLDEIKPIDEISEVLDFVKEKPSITVDELNLAKLLVDKYSKKHLDLAKYEDQYTKELRQLIDAKSRGEAITVKDEIKPKVQMEVLEALKLSLELDKKPKIEVKNESKTKIKKSLNSKGKNKKA